MSTVAGRAAEAAVEGHSRVLEASSSVVAGRRPRASSRPCGRRGGPEREEDRPGTLHVDGGRLEGAGASPWRPSLQLSRRERRRAGGRSEARGEGKGKNGEGKEVGVEVWGCGGALLQLIAG
jgi:hypothetical protein